MKPEDIIKEITLDDMPNNDFRFLAEMCGLEIAVKLLCELPGCTFFIPKEGFKNFYARRILSEYDGTTLSLKHLSIKYNTTEGNIREILKANRVNAPVEGQIQLF